MARLGSLLLIATLLIIGNEKQSYGKEFSIPPEAVQWGSDIAKVGMKMASGDPLKIAFGLTSEIGDVIDYYKKKPNKVEEKMINFSNQLNSLVLNVTNVQTQIIDELTSAIPDMQELKDCLKDISNIISYIEGKFNDYIAFVRKPLDFEKVTYTDFADSITSQDIHGLPHLLKALHEAFYKRNDAVTGSTVLNLLTSNTLAYQKMCERKQSLQQMLYILHNTIELADVKGYTMIQSAYEFKTAFYENSGGFKGEKKRAEDLFRERIQTLIWNVKSAMKSSSRDVWTCDTVYKEGVTYTKFDNLFRSYVLNIMSLHFTGSCVGQCESFYQKILHECKDELCEKQKSCDGEVSNCKTITRPAYICLSSPESNRVYDFIELGDSKKSCPNTMVNAHAWRIVTTDSCDYCMCTCDSTKNPKSDRYINLRPVTADTEKNYTVTGLRFVKKNHILHIQIKQGKLLPGGAIDDSTNHWKPIEAYEVGKIIPGTNEISSTDDYHKLENSILNSKPILDIWRLETTAGFNLDDVELTDLTEEGKKSFKKIMNHHEPLDWGNLEIYQYHLLTGVRLKKTYVKGSGKHIFLEVQMTPYNFTTGHIYSNKKFWYSKQEEFNKDGYKYIVEVDKETKSEINLDNLDLPINTDVRAKLTSQNNQFLKLTTSSIENDAGQNTIPFIDITSVETNPPMPLSGAGLIHKSSPGSGGFLALKLMTIDYEPYMKIDVPY